MKRVFMYGVSVEGVNFTDRVRETKRLKLNFENGLNTVLISPRRMGKTSLIKKVQVSIILKLSMGKFISPTRYSSYGSEKPISNS